MSPLPYRQEISACFAAEVKSGIPAAQWKKVSAEGQKVLASLQKDVASKALPICEVPSREKDIPAIRKLATRIATDFERLVVIGTGGSSLGARTLTELAREGGHTKVVFLENVDPRTIESVLQSGLAHSFFLIVSKSGGTLETLAQALICLKALRAVCGNDAPAKQAAVITMPGVSALRKLAEEQGLDIIDHPTDIGGRFSVLTSVGLLPAAVAGMDITRLRNGALNVVKQVQKAKKLEDAAPVIGACLQTALMQQGMNISVLMPYADNLFAFGAWFRQLWAESLGKDGKGSTPIRALGTVDQHSQLQLYLDGPRDKFFTLLLPAHKGQGPLIPASLLGDAKWDYLEGRPIGDVMAAEQEATAESLIAHGCPVRTISFTRADEETIGALLMHFMIETVAAARLLKVDAFDQPAVEDGKKRAHALLSGKKSPAKAAAKANAKTSEKSSKNITKKSSSKKK